jgi:hypothetical protein
MPANLEVVGTELDSEILTGMSFDELKALAGGLLVPASQSRLERLLAAYKDRSLSDNELQELDRLLFTADQLMILKTWARYTLFRLDAESAAK